MDYGRIDREGILAYARRETGVEGLRYLVMYKEGIAVYRGGVGCERGDVAKFYEWGDLDALGLRTFGELPQAVDVHVIATEPYAVLP